MPTASQGIATTTTAPDTGSNSKVQFTAVACPFCGLHCDDLDIVATPRGLHVESNGCARARAGFERPLPASQPAIAGRAATLSDAMSEASRLIAGARQPLFGGLGVDVEGMRAVMALADKAGGVVDHALSAAQYRNTGVLQTQGWIMSTLTEVRNRADLIIVVGSDLPALHPRFFDRIAAPGETMFGPSASDRTVVLLGCGTDADTVRAAAPRIGKVIDIPVAAETLHSVLGLLRAKLKDAPGATTSDGGDARLADLADRCRQAAYGVFVWAPQALTFPGADLVVQTVSDIVRDLNKTTRFAGLSLGGNDGAQSAASVCSWQTGYPLRVSFASGAPEYDPYRFDIARILAAGEGDLLVWFAAIDPALRPPRSDVPTVLIGAPGAEQDFEGTPAVFIPVSTPGLDHGGRLVRCDSVVSLPLRALRRSSHPTVPELARALEAQI
ncbi:MAG: formylmethanofuran dehydrogenase [Hyphomicrobiaceae bacterium]